jgi:hypothetical protein
MEKQGMESDSSKSGWIKMVNQLKTKRDWLIDNSIAKSTQITYEKMWNLFKSFNEKLGEGLPATRNLIELFFIHLFSIDE